MIKKAVLLLMALTLTIGGVAAQQKGKIKVLNESRFAALIEDPEVQIVDVRTSAEYRAGVISPATQTARVLNINVMSPGFEGDILRLLDTSRPVAIYCKTNGRSKEAAKILVKHGFTVYRLQKGVEKWKGELQQPMAQAM